MSKKSPLKEISREEAAAEVLSIWEETHLSLRTAMEQLAEEWGIIDWPIRTAIHGLVFETVRRLNTIDYVLNLVLEKTRVSDLDSLLRNTLRVASYLILFRKVVPALATNEAVSIIKRRRNKRLAGLANAVLRTIQEYELEEILQGVNESIKNELLYSVPQWFYDYTERLFGTEEARAFFSASLDNPSVYIRINTLSTNAKAALSHLERDEFQCLRVPPLLEVYKLQHGTRPVTQTTPYVENAIYIQSLASALVSHVANPRSDSIIIDLCAAPGSKTSHLAQLMKNRGHILAFDNLVSRTQELCRNLTRLGVRNTHVLLANSTSLPLRKGFRADRVLVDPPCSNTGVIQTRPEAKWIITEDLVQRLQKIQFGLLQEGSRFVADNGFLIYSTCSITLTENEQLVLKFLENQPKFILVQAEPLVGKEAFIGMTQCQRLFPQHDDTEGFFIAKFQRNPGS
ncbi:MAG: transcription antitermination factor NusB [Candidatus Hodarchaeota archaeon]